MPKVGQWGQLDFQRWFITTSLQVNQFKLPKTQITFTYKELQNVTMLQHIQKVQRYSKIQEM